MCRSSVYLVFCTLLSAQLAVRGSAQDNCAQDEHTLYCRGARALRNAMRNLSKSDKPLVIWRGLEIVPLQNGTDWPEEVYNATLLDSLAYYLHTHELNVKFVDFLADEQQAAQPNGMAEARKKDKGQGYLLAMALMFGKMMAVMGLGGIGALALKALGVAMMALMLAGLLGLKQAAQQGNETSHSISYLTAEGHHHRRRRRRGAGMQVITEQRPLAMAYKGWLQPEPASS